MSAVASIVATVGSFGFKQSNTPDKQMLIVQHPDQCFLLEPKPIADGMTTGADVVSVPPGKNTFKFDCDGKQIELSKDVKSGESIWKADPLH